MPFNSLSRERDLNPLFLVSCTATLITPATKDFPVSLYEAHDLSGNDPQISSNIYEKDSESSNVSEVCDQNREEDPHLLIQSENYTGK